MNLTHASSLDELLDRRQMSGAALARAVGAGEATISKIRNGLRPGEDLKQRIASHLKLSADEVAALGWNRD